nr:hypothetical protein [uncultured Acetatifactor sp.]
MIRLYHREREKSTLWQWKFTHFYNNFLQKLSKFEERPYRISIEVTFGEGILSGIGDPGLRDGEDIIFRTERVAALSVHFPDLQDGEALPIERMVGMEDRCRSQIPAVVKCFLLLLCQQ